MNAAFRVISIGSPSSFGRSFTFHVRLSSSDMINSSGILDSFSLNEIFGYVRNWEGSFETKNIKNSRYIVHDNRTKRGRRTECMCWNSDKELPRFRNKRDTRRKLVKLYEALWRSAKHPRWEVVITNSFREDLKSHSNPLRVVFCIDLTNLSSEPYYLLEVLYITLHSFIKPCLTSHNRCIITNFCAKAGFASSSNLIIIVWIDEDFFVLQRSRVNESDKEMIVSRNISPQRIKEAKLTG